MATTINNKYIVDLPEWRALSYPYAGNNAALLQTSGICMAPDMRARDYATPHVYFQNANILYNYHVKFDAFHVVTSLALGGTFAQGASAVFCPTFSPMGTIAAGATTNKFTLSTALPNSVSVNQLSNRGDGLGFIVRLIGNSAGGSGKIEERRVIANTSGTTPTIYVDKPFSFTPASGDRYEFLSGSVLFLNVGTNATASIFRRYNLLTNAVSDLSATGGSGAIANIPSSHNQLVALDEQYVPHDRNPGEGFLVGAATYDTTGDFVKNCLTATASAAATITGQATSGDASVVANQFRNYQIRIVEDTATPTAVGQRRRISGHTAGPSAVYTLANNWTVTPSATCKFVIENDTDRIIGFFGGNTTTWNYYLSNLTNTGATPNTWDTTSWGARASAFTNGGMTFYAFGVSPTQHINTDNTVKCSNIISFRGGSNSYDILDIAGGANGLWTNGNSVLNSGNTSNDAFVGANDYYYFAYNPFTQNGEYMYTALGGNTAITNQQRAYVRFNCINGMLEKVAGPKLAQGTTNGHASSVSFCSVFQDGSTKIAFYNTARILSGGTDYYQLMLTF